VKSRNTPERLAKFQQSFAITAATQEHKTKCSIGGKAVWANPETRAKITAAVSADNRTNPTKITGRQNALITFMAGDYKEHLAKIGQLGRNKIQDLLKNDPNYRERISANQWEPEHRAKMEKLWTDPKYRSELSTTMINLIISGEYRQPYSHYVTGDYESIKCGNKCGRAYHRSSWELIYYRYLDADIKVTKYISEPFKIKYEFNGSIKNYVPDILVWYNDNHQELVEIKPSGLLSQPQNMAKIKAAQAYCDLNNMLFVVLTEEEFQFK